ncbi:MAG: DNA polymerase III subunit delta' [Acidobacteria bacterium]|nr:DNA polymerase III subunit delta' [Acidobacteriota bacterium]
MAFSDTCGNALAKNILRKGLQKGRIPNSLLFTGPEGVGKMETALVLAKALNCLKKSDDSCDECANCRAIDRGAFPDVLNLISEKEMAEKYPETFEGGKNGKKPKENISIDQLREMKQTAHLRPMLGRKRVFLIGQAEQIDLTSSNTLLKILEEPPLFTHIILLSDNPYSIVPTIRSRCQILSFSTISREDVEDQLKRNGCGEQKARLISILARGNLKQAFHMSGEDVPDERKLSWIFLLALLTGEGSGELLKDFTSSRKEFREELVRMLEIMLTFIRDVMLLQGGGESSRLLNPDYALLLSGLAGRMSRDRILEFIGSLERSLSAVRKKANLNCLVSELFAEWMEKSYA